MFRVAFYAQIVLAMVFVSCVKDDADPVEYVIDSSKEDSKSYVEEDQSSPGDVFVDVSVEEWKEETVVEILLK